MIRGPVTIQSGGRIEPGASLTINNSLNLSGVTVMDLNTPAGTNNVAKMTVAPAPSATASRNSDWLVRASGTNPLPENLWGNDCARKIAATLSAPVMRVAQVIAVR